MGFHQLEIMMCMSSDGFQTYQMPFSEETISCGLQLVFFQNVLPVLQTEQLRADSSERLEHFSLEFKIIRFSNLIRLERLQLSIVRIVLQPCQVELSRLLFIVLSCLVFQHAFLSSLDGEVSQRLKHSLLSRLAKLVLQVFLVLLQSSYLLCATPPRYKEILVSLNYAIEIEAIAFLFINDPSSCPGPPLVQASFRHCDCLMGLECANVVVPLLEDGKNGCL